MKSYLYIFCFALMTAQSSFCDNELRPDQILIEEYGKDESGTEYQCIFVLLDDDKIRLGPRYIYGTGVNPMAGVDPETITSKSLDHPDRPILLEWKDYSEGMGNYQNQYFIILSAQKPHLILLRQSLMITGHWSISEGVQEANYKIDFQREPTITIRETSRNRETSGDACHYVTTYVREFQYDHGGFLFTGAFVEYQVRDGDTFESISRLLKVPLESFNQVKDFPMAGELLRVRAPDPYPIVEESTDRSSACDNS